MGGLETAPILEQLRSATTYADQAAALRLLKNDIVGHRRKKEAWVVAGVLEPVVRILATCRPSGKPSGKGSQFRARSRESADEESVRLQAIQTLATFANGGAPFLDPIYAAGAVGAILDNISPSANSPQIVHASLRALLVLADAAANVHPDSPCTAQVLGDALFTPAHVHSLQTILASSSPDSTTQSQINLAAELISRLCEGSSHCSALAKPNGILDALATRLASFAVADGLVIPGAERIAGGSGVEAIPEPAPRSAKLAPILRAIGSLVWPSKYRAYVLLTSPAILSVFPTVTFTATPAIRATWQPLGASRSERLSAMDYLLPAVPPQQGSRRLRQKTAESKDNGAAPVTSVQENLPESNGQAQDVSDENGGPESPFIPYLIYLSRSGDDMVRLMAIGVLTALVKAGFVTKQVREVTLSLLVVPPLVQLIRDHLEKQCQSDSSPSVDESTRESWTILENAPVFLSRLLDVNENLQRAAFECGAVETLAKLLQEAYKPAVVTQPGMWSAQADTSMDTDEAPASCTLGQAGSLPLLVHRTKLRESALKGIQAAALKDEHAKAAVDSDAMPYIAESLFQYPVKPLPAKERPRDRPEVACPEYGENPTSVLIAACHTVRMLARSISSLRTALVDFSVWAPILRFLRHPDVELQIAATAVTVNLLTDVSPMKETLIEQNVMILLCEHTRSSNASLRLNAMWALKHLMLAAEPALKKSCLEELEPGLLVRLICDDTEDNALGSSRAGVESPAFDTDDTMDEDVDMQQPEEQKGAVPGAGVEEASGRGRTRQMDERLARYREMEVNPASKARQDDLAIQEQALNFIRNLLTCGPGSPSLDTESETAQMVDYLFSELGQDRFLSILESKLRPKVVRPFSRRDGAGGGRESRVVYPQPQIIEAVIFILINLSAGAPRHRQLVIAQTAMLKQLGTYFNNGRKEVRMALCYLVSNLTWAEDAGDAGGCRQRALELKRLGFLGKVEGLREEDGELDVRERAKNALWQLEQPY